MATKEAVGQQENQFSIQPPLAYLQYQRGDQTTKQMILAKLKTLKSVARLLSKHTWHQWRLERQYSLNQILEENLSALLSAWTPLNEANMVLDNLISNKLEPEFKSLNVELTSLEHLKAFPDEIEQARQLELIVTQQNEQLNQMDMELAELERQEVALNAAINEATTQKHNLTTRIESAKQTLASTPKLTEMILNEHRSLLALRKASSGWEFANILSDSITLKYLIGGPVGIKIDFDPSTKVVKSVLLNGNTAKSTLLKSVHRLSIPTGLSLSETTFLVLQRLDSLVQLERSVSDCSLVPIEDTPDFAFCLSFFSYEARSKFDIALSLDHQRLLYAGFQHHYGPITEEHVHDYVGMALSGATTIDRMSTACKQIITSVQGLISEHIVDGRPSDAFSLCMNPTTD